MKLDDIIKEHKLSKVQKRAFLKLTKSGDWENAYILQESMLTLNSLYNKHLIGRKAGIGAEYDPRIHISFKSRYRYT